MKRLSTYLAAFANIKLLLGWLGVKYHAHGYVRKPKARRK